MNELYIFNSSLETGIRSLVILVNAFPERYDIDCIVEMDYLVVHTGDAGGPESLHANLPMRTGELLVRRSIIEKGLMLMMSKGLIEREYDQNGIVYFASETSNTFVNSFTSSYLIKLQDRAKWIVDKFRGKSVKEIREKNQELTKKWTPQFLPLDGLEKYNE